LQWQIAIPFLDCLFNRIFPDFCLLCREGLAVLCGCGSLDVYPDGKLRPNQVTHIDRFDLIEIVPCLSRGNPLRQGWGKGMGAGAGKLKLGGVRGRGTIAGGWGGGSSRRFGGGGGW
jgi:hypothetical protein